MIVYMAVSGGRSTTFAVSTNRAICVKEMRETLSGNEKRVELFTFEYDRPVSLMDFDVDGSRVTYPEGPTSVTSVMTPLRGAV